MPEGYLYRRRLVEEVGRALKEGWGLLVYGPPGFGKTLLLKEVARSLGLPYATSWRGEPGCYDLESPPPRVQPGQVVALRARPRELEPHLFPMGPSQLAFTPEEVAELARRLGHGQGMARKGVPSLEALAALGGYPRLVREALAHGVVDPAQEPLRGLLEAALGPLLGERLERFLVELPEAAWRAAGFGELLEALRLGGWAEGGEAVRLLPALRAYLARTRSLPPEDVERAAREAARLGYPGPALEAFLLLEAFPEAGALLEEAAPRWLQEGEAERVLAYWRRLPAAVRTARLDLAAAEAERVRGNLDRALALFQQARAKAAHPEVRAEALRGEGMVLGMLGAHEASVQAFRRGLEEAPEEARHRFLSALGAALIRAGRYAEAQGVLGEAIALARRLGDLEVLTRAVHNLGTATHHVGLLSQAIRTYREALALKPEKAYLSRAHTLLSLGESLRLAGRFQEAHTTLRAALEAARRSGDYRALGYTLLNLGDLYLEAGWLAEAEVHYREAEEILKPAGDPYGLGLVRSGQGWLLAQRGRPAQAQRAWAEAEALLARGGGPAELAEVAIAQARFLPRAEAIPRLERALAMAEEAGARRLALLARLERLLLELPNPSFQALAQAVAEALALEVLPLWLEPRYLPLLLTAAAWGVEGGRCLLEHLVFGVGEVRAFTLGKVEFWRERPVSFPTSKDAWVLLALWSGVPGQPQGLGRMFWPKGRNPVKRLQVAVHYIRNALGEDWVRLEGGRYVARPLPGTWWDAAILEGLARAARSVASEVHRVLKEAALALYRGPFAPGSPLEGARERYNRLFRRLQAL